MAAQDLVMSEETIKYSQGLRIGHFSAKNTPWRRLGQYLYRVVEDGSQTQMRLAIIESLLPPKSEGPVFHFHEMHDEAFIVTKGKVRFHSPGKGFVDAEAGDVVTVPIRLPHKFSNPFDEEAVFFNTATPGFFIRYFQYLEEQIGQGKILTGAANEAALRRFATIPLDKATEDYMEKLGGVPSHAIAPPHRETPSIPSNEDAAIKVNGVPAS